MSRAKDMQYRIGVDWLGLEQEPDEKPRVFRESLLPTDIPEDPQRYAECISHLNSGNGWELRKQFYSSDKLKAPSKDKPQEIITRLSCKGSCDLARCALKIAQYDIDGNHLASMSFEE